MAKKTQKRILAVLLTFFLFVGLMPVSAVRAEEKLTNVQLSPEGILTWDPFPGASDYLFSVGSGGGYAGGTSKDLAAECELYGFKSGTYDVVLYAIDENHETISEKWTGTFDYTSARPQLATPSNIKWNGGIVSWDPVPNAQRYRVIIDGKHIYVNECSADVSAKLYEGNKEYGFSICAMAEGYPDSESYSGTVELNILRDGLKNVSISEEGIVTWDAWPGADCYYFNVETAGGYAYGTYYNLYELCNLCGLESGTYEVQLFATNEAFDHLSGTWTCSYNFEKGKYYTVSFNPGDGQGAMQSINVLVGADFAFPENGFMAPNGCEFDCWEVADYGTFAPGAYFQPGSDMTVTAAWKEKTGDPSDYKATLEDIDYGEVFVGYEETTAFIFRIDITGERKLICDEEHYKIEFSGDTDAFELWADNGGTMLPGNMYNAGSVKPKTGMPEGTYKASASLYYDIDGNGTTYDRMLLDTAEFSFKVSPPRVQYGIHVSVYDITLDKKWNGGQVYLETVDEGTSDFQDSGYGYSATKDTVVIIKAAAKEGYEFVEWRLNGANGAVFSKEAEYDFYATEDLELHAIFKKIETAQENTPTPGETIDNTPTPGETGNKPTSGETTENTPTPKGSNHKTDYEDSEDGNGLLIFFLIAGGVVVVAGIVVAVILVKKKKK